MIRYLETGWYDVRITKLAEIYNSFLGRVLLVIGGTVINSTRPNLSDTKFERVYQLTGPFTTLQMYELRVLCAAADENRVIENTVDRLLRNVDLDRWAEVPAVRPNRERTVNLHALVDIYEKPTKTGRTITAVRWVMPL